MAGDSLLAAALAHGVLPLVYRRLAGGLTLQMPVFEQFRELARSQSVQVCALAAELAEVFSAFQRRGIKALALKGPALSALIYGNLAIRKCSDLDILVQKEDLEQASCLLLSQGYLELPRSTGEEGHKDRRYYRETDGITLELHWSFHDAEMHAQVDEQGVWKRMRTVSICSCDVAVPSIEDTLLYLCIHGAHHRWDRLKWVYDIAQLIHFSEQLDEKMVLRCASKYGCCRMLLVGVALASCLLGSGFPDAFRLVYSNDSVARLLVETARERLLSLRETEPDEFEATHYRERLRDRLVFLKNKWRPNSADALALPLPSKLSFLHYLTRPVRLAKVYGTGWLKPVLWDRP